MAHSEFVLVHLIAHLEWAHRSAICPVKLLGVSLHINIDSTDVVPRTGNRSTFNVQQCDVAVNTIQAIAVADGPAIYPPSMTYDGALRSDSSSSPHTI